MNSFEDLREKVQELEVTIATLKVKVEGIWWIGSISGGAVILYLIQHLLDLIKR